MHIDVNLGIWSYLGTLMLYSRKRNKCPHAAACLIPSVVLWNVPTHSVLHPDFSDAEGARHMSNSWVYNLTFLTGSTITGYVMQKVKKKQISKDLLGNIFDNFKDPAKSGC